MKKRTSLLLALAMALSLAACGNSGNQKNTLEPQASTGSSTAEETPAPTDTETPVVEPTEEPAESETPAAWDSSSGLIAYFSWSGNTEQGRRSSSRKRTAICLRSPRQPRTRTTTNELLAIAQQEQADNARPELAGQMENWEQYDTIFVG